ncbi:MAG: 3-oxoacyl-[acyl-carrier protein] reductase [Planctomycetaceae bacterium]|nr:3-oxoacyl-[acyl-carrier protein] reductase [Planctomycetaceae bacterium]
MKTHRWAQVGLILGGAALAGLAWAAFRRRNADWLTRKTVFITGGARGLGLVLARKIGDAGARVAICSRNVQQLERARDELQQRNIVVWPLECDVTDGDAVKRMLGQIESRWGVPDIVINNAGVIQMGPLESLTEADFVTAMETHFWAPLCVMREVIPGMRARGSGQIVNIASIGGKISPPHLVAYNSSKFALVGLSEGFAAELAKDGIRVTTICPGLMRTGSPRNALFKGRHREEYSWFSILGSLPGLSMSAEHAADKILSAMRQGKAVSILGLPAKLATLMHDLLPELTISGLAAANRFLPGIGGIGQASARGVESQSMLSPSLLTTLTEQAAVQNNEL